MFAAGVGIDNVDIVPTEVSVVIFLRVGNGLLERKFNFAGSKHFVNSESICSIFKIEEVSGSYHRHKHWQLLLNILTVNCLLKRRK